MGGMRRDGGQKKGSKGASEGEREPPRERRSLRGREGASEGEKEPPRERRRGRSCWVE